MKLMTQEILKKIPKLGTGENIPLKDRVVYVRFFNPWGSWTWYATEYSPEEKMFFGVVSGFETELGYFSLTELESARGPMGLRIERDLYFEPKKISEIAELTEFLGGFQK